MAGQLTGLTREQANRSGWIGAPLTLPFDPADERTTPQVLEELFARGYSADLNAVNNAIRKGFIKPKPEVGDGRALVWTPKAVEQFAHYLEVNERFTPIVQACRVFGVLFYEFTMNLRCAMNDAVKQYGGLPGIKDNWSYYFDTTFISSGLTGGWGDVEFRLSELTKKRIEDHLSIESKEAE